MTEEWRPVEGYEDRYEVSNLGRVRSVDRVNDYGRHYKAKMRKQKVGQHGYMEITLTGPGPRETRLKTFRVQRLVAAAFIPNPQGLPEVNHLNEDKTDNRVCNLCWSSRVENLNYGTRTKRQIETNRKNGVGGFGHNPIRVRCFSKSGEPVAEYGSISEAGKHTGISPSHICKCCKGILKSAGGYRWQYKTE